MSKKILVISPIPSHPQNAGNRARVYSLFLNLKEMGHDVYFLHIQKETGDEESMQSSWGNNFYSIPYQKPKTAKKQYPKRLSQKIIRKIQSFIFSDPLFTYSIDDWYDDSVNEKIINISNQISPHVVIVEYVFFSKALELFDKNIIKIIDTHDKFTDRYKLYQKKGKNPRWYSTTSKQEIKGLSRADVILSIQQKETNWFSKRLKKQQIVTVGHLVKLHSNNSNELKNTILFVGSKNPINVDGINYFIKQVFPDLKSKFKNLKLILAGDVCEEVEDFKDCIKLGRVENLKDAYQLADIVISPVLFGTGLKIKNIEALGYSKPLVTTSVGAEGMEEAANKAFLIANSPLEFVDAITKIFSDIELYKNLSQNAYNFAKKWNKSCLKILGDALNKTSQ